MGLIFDGLNNKIYNIDAVVITDNTGEEKTLTLNPNSTGSSKTLSFDGNRANKGYKFIITTGGSHPDTILTRTNSSSSPSDYLDSRSPTRKTISGIEYDVWTLDGGLYSFGLPSDSSKMFYFKNGKTYFYFYYEGLSGSGAHGTYGFVARFMTYSKLDSYDNICEIKNNLICQDITATGDLQIRGDVKITGNLVIEDF